MEKCRRILRLLLRFKKSEHGRAASAHLSGKRARLQQCALDLRHARANRKDHFLENIINYPANGIGFSVFHAICDRLMPLLSQLCRIGEIAVFFINGGKRLRRGNPLGPHDNDNEGMQGVGDLAHPLTDAAAQARRVFDVLRGWDDDPTVTQVYAACPSSDGLGLAVYNRLLRAAEFEVIVLDD